MNARTIVTRRVVCLAALCVSLVVAPIAGQGGPPPAGQAAPPAQDEAALVARARGDSRARDHARHAQRHQPDQLHAGVQLHDAPDDAGEPAEDGGGRPRRVVHDRLRRPGPAHARGLRQRVPAGGREVRRGAPADRADRAGQIGLALTPADVVRHCGIRAGRWRSSASRTAIPIGTDIKRVKEFCRRGGRYMSLAHNGHSQLVGFEHRRGEQRVAVRAA